MAARWKMAIAIFSFGCKSYKQSSCEGPAPMATPIKHKIPHLEPQNIRRSILDFTSRFGEIYPDLSSNFRKLQGNTQYYSIIAAITLLILDNRC